MNANFSLLDGAPDWFVALLNLSLQAAMLALIVFAITRCLGRWIPPNWRALLWFLVMARVLIPFSPPSPFSLQNLYAKRPQERALTATVQILPALESVPPPLEMVLAPTRTPQPLKPSLPMGRSVMIVWAAIAALCVSILFARYAVIRKRLSASKHHGESFETILSELKVWCPVRIESSHQIAAPALTGLIPARLVIPANFADLKLTTAEIRHILLHEIAHVRQGHLILHWLAMIARALHWFNPAIHFAATQMRRECELAADQAALKNASPEERLAYGETLLKVLRQSIAPPTSLALGMAEQARHLEQRLNALRAPSRQTFRILGALVFIALSVSGLSRAQLNEPAQAPSTDQTALRELHAGQDANKTTQRHALGARNIVSKGVAEKSWNFNPHTKNPQTNSAPRRELIRKLESIRIDEFPLEKPVALDDLLKSLGQEIKRREPAGKGVNLLIAPSAEKNAGAIDVAKFQVMFDSPIRDVTLGQFLDAIARLAKPPQGAPANAGLKYSVEDYAIVFSERPAAGASDAVSPIELLTRTYKLNPHTVALNLQKNMRAAAANEADLKTNVLLSLRHFIASAGVDFPTNQVNGPEDASSRKAIFYKDQTGILYVRATAEDLERIENAVQILNFSPPQITFEVRAVDLDADLAASLLKAFPSTRNVTMTNEIIAALPKGSSAATPALRGNVALVKKMSVPISSTIELVDAAEYVLPNVRVQELLKAVESRQGVDIVQLPTVTTLVGRQALVSIEDAYTAVTEGTVVVDNQVQANAVQHEKGARTWIDPQQINDKEVQYSVTFEFADFLGYAEGDKSIPLPLFRLSATTATLSIAHGHTQVIVQPTPLQAPLAEVPFVGVFFRKEPPKDSKRRTILMLTPVVVDAQGNAVYK